VKTCRACLAQLPGHNCLACRRNGRAKWRLEHKEEATEHNVLLDFTRRAKAALVRALGVPASQLPRNLIILKREQLANRQISHELSRTIKELCNES